MLFIIHFWYILSMLNSIVILWSDFGQISQQILGLQIDHKFGLGKENKSFTDSTFEFSYLEADA
jgi:hypothetical protein